MHKKGFLNVVNYIFEKKEEKMLPFVYIYIYTILKYVQMIREKKEKLIGQKFHTRDISKTNRLIDQENYRLLMSRRGHIPVNIDPKVFLLLSFFLY